MTGLSVRAEAARLTWRGGGETLVGEPTHCPDPPHKEGTQR